MRVLVAEDEEMLADAIAEGLRREAMAVDVVYDGASAMDRLTVNDYDVLVLDRDLPRVHGDDVCRQFVRSEAATRVLMVTASGELADLVAGLSLGADDYLAKPFAFAELVARVRALSRRARPAAPPVLDCCGVRLDQARRQVERDGRHVSLSRKEFGVLQELMLGAGAAVSAEFLLEKVWDENTDPFTNVLRVTVMTLRRKNAIRHNLPDGWVRVELGHIGDHARLAIANSGPVVAPSAVPQLFQPFTRVAGRVRSVRGTGLGLSIAHAVVRAHGGTVNVTPRPQGGLLMEVHLRAVTILE